MTSCPFFSRRIGLVEGSAVPIGIGGKVNGRVGRTNVGALAVRTARGDGLVPEHGAGRDADQAERARRVVRRDRSRPSAIRWDGAAAGWPARTSTCRPRAFAATRTSPSASGGSRRVGAISAGDASAAGFTSTIRTISGSSIVTAQARRRARFSRRSASSRGRASTATRPTPISSRARTGAACGRCSTSSAIRW